MQMAVDALGDERHRHVLLMRFVLLNTACIAVCIAAYYQGWLDGLFQENMWIASCIIAAGFIYGLVLCGLKVWQTMLALDAVRAGSFGPDSRVHHYLETTDFQ